MRPFNPYSLGNWITRRADITPDRTAVDFEDRAITYEELNDRANRAASVIAAMGIGKGDHVSILSENRPEYLEVFFACAKLGAVLVPISWRLAETEMAWQVDDSTPKVLVADTPWSDTARTIFQGEVLELSEGGSYEQALGEASPEEPDDSSGFEDPLMILYTSGTTGRPKGAVLTHGNFFWANLNMLVSTDILGDEVSLMFLPMFHIGGWNVNTLVVLLKGGTVVLERQFDAARVLELIPKKQVSLLMGVPATYLFMSQEPAFESADLSSVRLMIVGGAPMPEPLLEAYASKGIDVVQGYGLTELSPNALILPTDQVKRKLGSAGKPYFFTDTRVLDAEGNPADWDATGEIVARGPVVMKEYWRRPDATAETIKDGWLHTGDVGRADEEGFIYVVDRVKDMIISGGENIYPAEIENALYSHEAVGEVAVIGVPDEKWGEVPHAIVVAKQGASPSEDELIEHCSERLSSFKVPRSVELRWDALPRTPAGKVKKPELRAPFWEGKEKKI